MSCRVRFAPSPTGHIHVGNIRVAMFNWLFARHNNGKFLVRVEDTDRERNTSEAINTLFDCMQWLGIDYNEEVFYQSLQRDHHLEEVKRLLADGNAYQFKKGDGGEAVMFRLPQVDDNLPFIESIGEVEQEVHENFEIKIDFSGFSFALVSKKGKAVPQENMALAGFKNLQLYDENNKNIFSLNKYLTQILANKKNFSFSGIKKIKFHRQSVVFEDIVKGRLAKPMDGMKDIVLLKSNGDPLFHLANVCDDISQKISHIIRGDDHVENTYRHLLLYHCLGAELPKYGHLPMISNEQGKPYSKRDGDAFVSDFKKAGYLPEALFNFLVLLGWSVGDEEKVSRQEMINKFDLKDVKSTSAQMNLAKLFNFNSLYLQEKTFEQFLQLIEPYIEDRSWLKDEVYFNKVASLMQSRTKVLVDVLTWQYFFTNDYKITVDEKRWRKTLQKDFIPQFLLDLAQEFGKLVKFDVENIKKTIEKCSQNAGFEMGKLNLAVRLAISGAGGGAEIFDTIALIGQENAIIRLIKCAKEIKF